LVNCERSNIQQVFLNVLRNGAQAMMEIEHKKEDPCFTFRIKLDNDMVRIEIEDNGPGMDEESRRRAFEPFYTTKEVNDGTGLGLSVSYFIINEQHKGQMVVESKKGFGTNIIINLHSFK
jgi:C4-dicarboxylate-specific signal transduction histidine kinase